MFKRKQGADGRVYGVPSPIKTEMREIEKACARLFASDDGQKVLAYLQAVSFARAMGAESTEAQLRYMEGQRAMVAGILRLIDRGRMSQ